ncbi:MAG: hypothetical protein AAB669_01850 [Patescibacteria group bacterium]
MMRYVLTLLGCFLAVLSTAQEKAFTEDELRQAAKKFMEVPWDLGQKTKEKPLLRPEIERAIDDYLLAKTPLEEWFDASFRHRRGKAVDFAEWVYQLSIKAKDYALKPFIGLRMATKEDTSLFKDTVVWRITVIGDDGIPVNVKWIIYMADAVEADINASGQRILKVASAIQVSDPAPATAGACS